MIFTLSRFILFLPLYRCVVWSEIDLDQLAILYSQCEIALQNIFRLRNEKGSATSKEMCLEVKTSLKVVVAD